MAVIFIYKNNVTAKELALVSRNYNMTSKNYNTTIMNLSILRAQFSNLTQSYDSLNEKYIHTESNLTTPYTEVLFNNELITVPASYYDSYTGLYFVGVYNYSFDAPYSGYLIINATPSILNNDNYDNWVIYFSQEKPYFVNGTLSFDRYLATFATIAPAQGITYIVPVHSGMNYMLIYNVNYTIDSTIGIFMNMKYVGFHTS